MNREKHFEDESTTGLVWEKDLFLSVWIKPESRFQFQDETPTNADVRLVDSSRLIVDDSLFAPVISTGIGDC